MEKDERKKAPHTARGGSSTTAAIESLLETNTTEELHEEYGGPQTPLEGVSSFKIETSRTGEETFPDDDDSYSNDNDASGQTAHDHANHGDIGRKVLLRPHDEDAGVNTTDFGVKEVEESVSHCREEEDDETRRTKKEFLLKIHDMLEHVEIEHQDHIISWSPDGMSFKVHNPEAFVKEIMPRYSSATQFRSFQKMLNLYDFKKIKGGPQRGGYEHPMFRKGDRDLCKQMKMRPRQRKSTTTGSRGTSSGEWSSGYDDSLLHARSSTEQQGRFPSSSSEGAPSQRLSSIHDISMGYFQQMMTRYNPISSTKYDQNPYTSPRLNYLDHLPGTTPSQSDISHPDPGFLWPVEERIHPTAFLDRVHSPHEHQRDVVGTSVSSLFDSVGSAPALLLQHASAERSSSKPSNDNSKSEVNRFQEPLSDDLEPTHLPPG